MFTENIILKVEFVDVPTLCYKILSGAKFHVLLLFSYERFEHELHHNLGPF